jgi:uncharacterized protein
MSGLKAQGARPRAQGSGRRAQGSGRRAQGVLLFAALALAITLQAQALPPELTQPVNDFAHVIDPASAAEMDAEIRALKAASGDVVVAATVDTFAPYGDIREYAVKMFENRGRGIGDKGKDNGLLVVLAVKDRRVQVEVGYDLEQFVTDGFAGEVSRTVMAPAFARAEYGAGLRAGVQQLIARIAQSRGVTVSGVPQSAAPSRRSSSPIPPGLIFFVIIVVIALSQALRRSAAGPGRRWGVGPWSGWNSGVGSFGGGGGFGGGGFGGGFGGFGGGGSGGGGGGASW